MDDAQTLALLDLTFDHVCTRPLGDFVDVDALIASLDQSATAERQSYWQTRLLIPLRDRVLARAKDSTITVAEWFPEDIARTLGELLGEPAPIPSKVVDELVGSERVRDAVRAMMNEALTAFIAKANAAVEGAGDGAPKGALRGALSWGARTAGTMAKSLAGGIGEEIQKQLQGRVRDFVDSSVNLMQDRISERLKSDDTARALGKRRRKFFETALTRTESQLTAGARRAPWARIDPWVPRLIAHNLGREALRVALRDELRAVVAELSTEPLGATLDHAGLRDVAREAFRRHGGDVLRGVMATEAFAAWRAAP